MWDEAIHVFETFGSAPTATGLSWNHGRISPNASGMHLGGCIGLEFHWIVINFQCPVFDVSFNRSQSTWDLRKVDPSRACLERRRIRGSGYREWSSVDTVLSVQAATASHQPRRGVRSLINRCQQRSKGRIGQFSAAAPSLKAASHEHDAYAIRDPICEK